MSRQLDRLTLLETFVRIADAGSISAAARDLDMSQPSVSRQLALLENRFQAQLMRRNTHALSLTEAGSRLLQDARQILDEWEAIEERHRASGTEIRGSLKVVAPVALGQRHLVTIACEFQARHPRLSLTWELEDHPIRFTENGCDCWIKIGPIDDDTLVVRRLGRVERQLVAAPKLLEGRGQRRGPRSAEELPLVALDPFEGDAIPLRRQGKTEDIQPPVRMRTNNIFALKQAVLHGNGMGVLPTWFIARELKEGRLVSAAGSWKAPSLDIHLAYLPGRFRPLRLRAWIDELSASVPRIEGISA